MKLINGIEAEEHEKQKINLSFLFSRIIFMQSYFDPFFQVGKVARRHGNTQEMISPFIEMKCKKLEQQISRSQNFDSVFLVPVSVCFFLMRYRNI